MVIEKDSSKVIAERLLKLRTERDWSKTEAAERLGTKLSTYANWEYGSRSPKRDMIKKIATLYNVPFEFVLGYTDERDIEKFFANNHDKFKNVISDIESERESNFIKAITNPELKRWIVNDVFTTDEEDLIKLKKMWDLLQDKN